VSRSHRQRFDPLLNVRIPRFPPPDVHVVVIRPGNTYSLRNEGRANGLGVPDPARTLTAGVPTAGRVMLPPQDQPTCVRGPVYCVALLWCTQVRQCRWPALSPRRLQLPGKARVHEIARELGKTSKQIMALLSEMGEFVKSPSSTIEDRAVQKLRERFASGTASAQMVLPSNPTVRTPTPRTSDFLAPLLRADKDAAARRAAASIFDIDPEAIRLRKDSVPKRNGNQQRRPEQSKSTATQPSGATPNSQTIDPHPRPPRMAPNPFAATSGVMHGPTAQRADRRSSTPRVASAQDFKTQWAKYMFESTDRTRWEAAGLRSSESMIAAQCVENDITPDMLSQRLSGSTVLERLRSGESPAQVWARLREAAEAPERTGKLLGRFGATG
jgi:hypothetical protein